MGEDIKVGVISSPEPYAYGETTTYTIGAEFLAPCSLVEDWGCGRGHLRTLIPRERYRGIDIGVDNVPQTNPFADEQVDLVHYRSVVPGIFMRHVLEHNFRWREILQNAVESFTERFCLIIFTPIVYGPSESVIALHGRPEYDCYPMPVPNLALPWPEILRILGPNKVTYDHLATATHYGQEHVFRVERGLQQGSG